MVVTKYIGKEALVFYSFDLFDRFYWTENRMENSFIDCCKTKKPGFHRETRGRQLSVQRENKETISLFLQH